MEAFVRIQKTGSTSLGKVIEEGNQTFKPPNKFLGLVDHGFCYKITKKETGWTKGGVNFPAFDIFNYTKLYTVVRNPFEILLSYFFHDSIPGHPPLYKGWCNCNIVHGFRTWKEFLSAYLSPNFEWHLPPLKFSMFASIYDQNQNLIIDKFFKLENIEELNSFLNKRDYESIPYLKETITPLKPRTNLNKYYTKQEIKLLKIIWEKDLEYFNYDFPN